MKLARLRVRNFRCFQTEVAIDFGDLTALVGRNDAGKSTVMDALDLFLNDNDPDKDDASRGGDAADLTIICEFTDLPEEVILDDSNPTSFETEFLLNSEGRLEIHKTYSGELQKPKCRSVDAYAVHPTAPGTDNLLQLKNPELKARASELSVDLEGVDQRVNAQLRARIRQHVGELQLVPSAIPLNEDNAKKIWGELRRQLPAYALFKSDRASTDQDPEAQDPLKAAVKEAIRAKEAELASITEYVRVEVQKIAELTLTKLREMDPTLATQLNPTFVPAKWESLFKASITSDDDIPINKRGSGVRRLILLNFFRAKAEQGATETDRTSIIYAVEEPETSQHPSNQRILLRALSDLSSEAQVIMSTHTPMLARGLPDEALRYIHIEEDKSRSVLVGGPGTNEIFAKSLGVLPDSNVKLFIGVEGPNDIKFLQSLACALRSDGHDVPNVEQLELDGELIFLPLGGTTLAHWASRLRELNKPEFHLCDRDTTPPAPPKWQAYVEEVNARPCCKACSTAKKEIENYLHKDAIIAAYAEFGIELAIESNFGPHDDVPQEVARLVHGASSSPQAWNQLSDGAKAEKESKAKRVLSTLATKHMNSVLLGEVDPDGELLGWFEEIKDLMS